MVTLFSLTTTTRKVTDAASLAPASREETTRDLKAHPFVILALPLLVAATAPLVTWMATANLENRRLDNGLVLECAKRQIANPSEERRPFCPEISPR